MDCRLGNQLLPEHVLVAGAGCPDAAVVFAEGLGEKFRLLAQTQRASIQFVRTQRLVDQLLESVNRLRLPPEMVIKAQNLGDEPRPQAERGLRGLCRDASGRTGDDIA